MSPPGITRDESPGRRERKKQRTRRELQAAALRLAAEHGLHGVTTEDIAEAADVAPRTFFNYFASKEHAVVGADPGRAQRLHAALLARPAVEAPVHALRGVMLELAEEMVAHRDEWLQRVALIRSDPRLLATSAGEWSDVERALAEGVAERTGHDVQRDPYPALVVAGVVSVTRVAVMRWRAGAGQHALSTGVAAAIDALAAGLPAPDRQS